MTVFYIYIDFCQLIHKIGLKGFKITILMNSSSFNEMKGRALQEVFGDLEISTNEEDSVRYGSIPAWAKEFGVDKGSIERRLKDAEGIQAKDVLGRTQDCLYYSEEVVRRACLDLFLETPIADERGFFIQNGMRYGTTLAWARDLGVGIDAIQKRTEHAPLTMARIPEGNLLEFFGEDIILEVCADLLQSIDIQGEFLLQREGDEEVRYGSINRLAKLIGIPEPTLNKRIRGKSHILVRDPKGRVYKYFSEKLAREVSGEFLTVTLRADASGYVMYNGERYTTIFRFCKDNKSISEQTLKKRVNQSDSIRAKDHTPGNIRDFYPEKLLIETSNKSS